MQENEPKKKRKSGLHKEISSIFEGVPIPGKNGTQQPPKDSAPKQAEQGPVRESTPPVIQSRQAKHPLPKAKTSKSILQKMWQKITNKFLQPQEGVSSSRQKVMLLLVPVLILVLVLIFARSFKTIPRKIGEPEGVESKVAEEPKTKIDWKIPEPYPPGLRDPTRYGSPSTTAGAADNGQEAMRPLVRMPVKGIVFSYDSPAAVVGTQLVHEGDKISNVTIVKINEDSVEFKLNSKTWLQKVE